MPRLWNETIAEHRRDVRAAIIEATGQLVQQQGLTAVKMAHVAERAGIGRATLYKYFPDVGSILSAWHERHVADHLAEFRRISTGPGAADRRLQELLTAYATVTRNRGMPAADVPVALHRQQHVATAHAELADLITGLLEEAARAGRVRGDIDPAEMARYCLAALTAAGTVADQAAVLRLVSLVQDGVGSGPPGPSRR